MDGLVMVRVVPIRGWQTRLVQTECLLSRLGLTTSMEPLQLYNLNLQDCCV